MKLTPQEISIEALQEKYCKGEESTIDDVRRRVARALASVESDPERWEPVFLDAQENGVVMAGRINSAAGTALSATWINCFVQPVADSISHADDDGYPGIYVALREATETMRRGGGVGYDFSRLRPKGAYVKSTQSEASGPISYMRVFDRSCETVESAGARRGAQMGMLRVDHPDIVELIHAKDERGELTNFNLSVSVTDAFMQAVIDDAEHELVHSAAPGGRLMRERDSGSRPMRERDDGLWVYRTVRARDLWHKIMASTYDHGEPGVFFLDRVNAENNLYYCERIEASNPCAEQCLPPYGCCCLGSLDLTAFVRDPFSEAARFDKEAFRERVAVAVRMLDNVLDATSWPLEAQAREARQKRRVGLGFLGLGNALTMLGLRYDAEEGRAFAAEVARVMRDAAYLASVALAKERGAFPLFEAERYLDSAFARRLPGKLRLAIRVHGIRNSHLLSIAPTGTISLVFADNASNGIEPAFAWTYERRKRVERQRFKTFKVEDHAFRLYRELGLDTERLPPAFVSALEISAWDHARMVAVVQEHIDSSISKTVNVPADYPFEDFKDLYVHAWKAGAKSLATFRPNEVTGSLLSVPDRQTEGPQGPHDLDDSDPDRRILLEGLPTPTLNSLRWPKRPTFDDGNPAHCYRVKHPSGASFALFIGHVDDGAPYPFEVWVNGIEQPRGLNALAINLSYDMYARDRGWLKKKLDSLARCVADGEGFHLPMPPDGTLRYVPSHVAAMAALLYHRCTELGAFDAIEATPVLAALMSPKEPKTGPDGTMSWTVDVKNPSTQDDFVLGLKELVLRKDGRAERRPYSIWLSGEYPKALDGLCKALSLDMRIIDPAWIGKKLRELLNYAEPKGDFFAPVPGRAKSTSYPSTVAYLARLVIHRYAMVGILDDEGFPIETMGVVQAPERPELAIVHSVGAMEAMPGAFCAECRAYAVVKVDGCERCTACGAIGACG